MYELAQVLSHVDVHMNYLTDHAWSLHLQSENNHTSVSFIICPQYSRKPTRKPGMTMAEVSLGKLETESYRWAYGLNRFNMGIIGTWPEDNENFIVKNRAYAYAFTGMLMIWAPMTWSIAYQLGDLEALIRNFVISVPVGVSFYKIALFRMRRKVITTMLAGMATDWARPKTDEELEAMRSWAKYGRVISVMSVTLSTSMFVSFTAGRGAAGRAERQLSPNETALARGFLFPSYFPYDTDSLKGFIPTWFLQWTTAGLSLIGYAGPDSLMAMIILHLCGQLATVKIALINIVDKESIRNPNLYWERLSAIIKRHEELNRFGEMLEGSFNGMLLIQMVLCTVTFCFQGFDVITGLIAGLTGHADVAPIDMLFKVIQGFYTILHLFVYCWAGDLLSSQSTSLSYAPYESEWFLLPPVQAKALTMVTYRARIPLQITAGKFVGFSLELFTTIIKTAASYLSVLLAVQEEEE